MEMLPPEIYVIGMVLCAFLIGGYLPGDSFAVSHLGPMLTVLSERFICLVALSTYVLCALKLLEAPDGFLEKGLGISFLVFILYFIIEILCYQLPKGVKKK